MKKKVIYIIGSRSKPADIDIVEKFKTAELNLISLGFRVYNPIGFMDSDVSMVKKERKVKNIQKLFNCDAVYILPCAFLEEDNFELKMAVMLDLLLVHGPS